MGANLSSIPYEDPGPAVTKERLTRIIKEIEGTSDFVIESVEDQAGQAIDDGLASDMGVVEVRAKFTKIVME